VERPISACRQARLSGSEPAKVLPFTGVRVAKAWAQGGWHDVEQFEVVFAPCGVEHGTSTVLGEALWGGFAAPPQLDLYARTPYYRGTGTFAETPFGRLDA
jgi:hypothetical protein